MIKFKICKKCGKKKPISDFPFRKDNNIYRGECKECRKRCDNQYYIDNQERILKQNKEYRRNNREKYRIQKIKKNYNLSHKDWLILWERQNTKCAICGKLFKTPSDACVDHCHKTGKVRGLLCGRCNTAIGLLKEDLETLSNAMKYLERK